MNLGERIKQLRADKNLTQPQLAEAVGIEQSYLSKLENDKSIPSADIFSLLLKGLNISAVEFLQGMDKDWVNKQLNHIPDVVLHLSEQTRLQIHSVKKWLYISSILCIAGLTLIVAGYRGLIFSNTVYQYESQGITKPEEPLDLFLDRQILAAFLFKTSFHSLSKEQADELVTFEIERKKFDVVITGTFSGSTYIEKVDGGFRNYYLRHQQIAENPANKWIMLSGFFLLFSGIFGFITEYRLRKLQA